MVNSDQPVMPIAMTSPTDAAIDSAPAPLLQPVGDGVGARRLRSALARMSPGTVRAYDRALVTFTKWIAEEFAIAVDEWWDVLSVLVGHGRVITGDAVDRFVTNVCVGLAPATVAQRLAAIRWALAVMYEAGIIDWTVMVRSPKVIAYRDTRGPDLNQVQALYAAADATRGVMGLRDAALVRALFVLGLRRGEVTDLSVDDWDREVPGLWVKGKGRDDRELVAAPSELAKRLEAYLAARAPAGPEQPLFATHGPRSSNRPLQGDAIRRVLSRLSLKAGLRKPVRPHGLRHAAITHALDVLGGDVRRVARFSRHRKVETVSLYDDRRRDLAGDVSAALEALVETGGPPTGAGSGQCV